MKVFFVHPPFLIQTSEMQKKLIGELFNLCMIMKKLFNSIFVIIAAMVTFAGCAKEEIAAPETKTVQFFAESIETKTTFGAPNGTTYPTLWTENDEKVKILLNLNEEMLADVTPSDDFKTASFSAKLELNDKAPSVAPFTFYAITPASAYLGKNTERFSVTIPNAQTPLENSVDEAAQILYAVSESFEELPSEVSLNFNHFTAYGKLSFKNLNLNGAKIESVALTSEVNIAGRWNYMIADGSFAENSGSNSITLNTDKTENIWFACAPADLSNTTLKVVVNTDKGTLTKEIDLTANHKFEAGKIAKFSIDMQGITFGKDVVYELVTDAVELTPESEIIIVSAESELALSTTQNNNNRGQASVKKSDDGTTITNPGDDVQVITVEEGLVDGTVAFNVGGGYLYAASSGSNHLKTETTLDENGSWLVTISEGIASIVAQGANTRNILRYNDGNSIFSCYGSGQKDVAIYKLQGSGTVLENYLRVSTAAIDVTSDATSASFTVSSDLQWTVAVSSGATATVEGNKVTVSFAANTAEQAKTYTATVSASGVESKTVTITQAKKILKTKLTVAEFKELPDNANDLYELTGEITGIYKEYDSSYNNISFYLTDATGTITIYRMSCEGIDHTKVVEGNTITVKGLKGSYNGTAQMAQGGICLGIVEATPNPGGSDNDDNGDNGDNDDNGDNTGVAEELTWSIGTNAYSEKATINGTSDVPVLKLGKSSAAGSATFTLKAGTNKIAFSAVAWKGTNCTLQFTVGSQTYEQAIKGNDGATSNSPYTITSTSSDNYEVAVNVTAETVVTVTTTSKARAIIWDLKAISGN